MFTLKRALAAAVMAVALGVGLYAFTPADSAAACTDPGGWVPAPCGMLTPGPGGSFLANTGEVFVPRGEDTTARSVFPRSLFSYHLAITNYERRVALWERCIAGPRPEKCGPAPSNPPAPPF